MNIDELQIDRDGCCLLPEVVSQEVVNQTIADIEATLDASEAAPVRYRSKTFGARNLASNWDGWRSMTDHESIQTTLRQHVGPSFGLVRILYFDKPPGDGWSLPWHRDQTIAVKEHRQPIHPFSKPTVKAGVPHVEATSELLQQMLTLRFSLDPMTPDNGPLLFIPGSHEAADKSVNDDETKLGKDVGIELKCDAGDVFVMRPRLIHASRNSTSQTSLNRRVLHMEFAPGDGLPLPWQWNLFKPL